MATTPGSGSDIYSGVHLARQLAEQQVRARQSARGSASPARGGDSPRVRTGTAPPGAMQSASRPQRGAATAGAPVPAGATAPSASSASLEARLSAMASELRGLKEENARLHAALSKLSILDTIVSKVDKLDEKVEGLRVSGIVAPGNATTGAPGFGATGPIPADVSSAKHYSDMRIWTGTWNMGAADPFDGKDISKNMDLVSRTLEQFVPKGYDMYVLGVQECISDKVFEAVAAYTGCLRLPLHAKLEPARESRESTVRSRRMGRAICVKEFLDDLREGREPAPVMSMADMLDRVYGRGDGAFLQPKFTGLAVFVSKAAANFTRLLGVYKHSFGAMEGSKGGVGVAMGLYDQTVVFVNAHMASKRLEQRQQQYCDIVERLGAKLGGRGFQLNEEFHHVIWMGDLNYHCTNISASDAVALIRQGNVATLLERHDELIKEREAGRVFFNYDEPTMPHDFYPTYKKIPGRGRADPSTDPDWVDRVYETAYTEPIYKGGRTVDRVPSWTDRIQFHSLPSRQDDLLPESTDETYEDAPHNYRAVNDGMDLSDHSPVFCTWKLRISIDDIDRDRGATAFGQQGLVGIDLHVLPPPLRPVSVVLSVTNVRVAYKGLMRSPRALSMLFPLPYEDGNTIPERAKIVRSGTMLAMSPRSDSREGLAGGITYLVSRASRLGDLHLLIKVSLDDNTKAQAVTSLRDCGITGPGRFEAKPYLELMRNGTRAMTSGASPSPIDVQFDLEFFGHPASDQQIIDAQKKAASNAVADADEAAAGPAAAGGGGAAAASGPFSAGAALDRVRNTPRSTGAAGALPDD